MPKSFIVRERVKTDSFTGTFTAVTASLPIVFIMVADSSNSLYQVFFAAIAIYSVFILISPIFRPLKLREASVTVFPLGLQLVTSYSNKQPTLLLHQEIVDCIVNEVILAHKVINVILFRCYDAKGNIKLVQAFPGMQLNYRDCLRIRSDLQEALHLQSMRINKTMQELQLQP
jgi:hypothetical protein